MNELGADVKDDAQVRQWSAGSRVPNAANCLYLERATKAQVTRQAMRPKDFAGIWPELAPKKVRVPHA
jgi:DNA-binding transcriptional regulator YdaS (Cro superfamily)